MTQSEGKVARSKLGWWYHAPVVAYLVAVEAVSVALALSARRKPYFAIDIKISKTLQSFHPPGFDWLMRFVCGLGYPIQANLLGGLLLLGLYRLGLHWEAWSTLFAAVGSALLALVLILWVNRPRPTADLVRISHKLPTTSFPSGHVLIFTAVLGFLCYLAYRSKMAGIFRIPLLAVLGGIVALMGPARIYSGEHWASDVLAGYLLGSSWLALSARFYDWGRTRSRIR